MKTTYLLSVTMETKFEPTVREHMAASIQLDRALTAVPGVTAVVITDMDQLEEANGLDAQGPGREIWVNGIQMVHHGVHITYDNALVLAGYDDPSLNLSVTYRIRATNTGGILHRNGPHPLTVDGMVINVADTGNA